MASLKNIIQDKDGYVGIGTYTPSYTLDVSGSARASTLLTDRYVMDSGDTNSYLDFVASDQVRIVAGGVEMWRWVEGGSDYTWTSYPLGIGTTSPAYMLDISTSGTQDAQIALRNTSTGDAGIYFDASNGDLIGSDYAWLGQRNSLIFEVTTSPSSGDIVFSPAGTERVRFTTGGNVGIGTTGPTSKLHIVDATNISAANSGVGQLSVEGLGYTLGIALDSTKAHIYHNSSLRDLSFGTDESVDMTIEGSTGNVGIGTTSPDNKLHVHKGSAGTITANTNSPIVIENSTSAYLNILVPDENESGILFGRPTSNVDGGIIYNSNISRGLEFRTAGNTYRMGINSNGNVGIGTTSPNAQLQIDTPSTNNAGQGLRLNRPSAGTHYHSVEFATNGTVDWSVGQNSNDAFEVYENGAAATTRFTIKEGGNVGIGTTSPSSKLHINYENAESVLTISRGGTDLASNTAIGTIEFKADYQGSPISYGSIDMYANSTSGVRSSLDFNVKSTSGNIETGLTVQGNSGTPRVGIGTTSPSDKVEVSQGWLKVQGEDIGGVTPPYARIGQMTNAYQAGISSSYHLQLRSGGSGNIYFTEDGNVLAIISNAGNVGIGTTSPGAKLDVAGQIRQIGGGDYWYVSSAATFTSSGKEVTMSRSSAGYVVATPYGAVKKFNASVAFKTTTSTHLGITFLAADASAEDNNYAVILRNVNTVRVQKRVSGTQTYPISEVSLSGTDIDDGNWHTISVSFDGAYISVDVDGTNYISQAWTDTSFTSGMVGPTIYDGSVEFNDFSCSELTSKNVNSTLLVSGNVGIGTTSPSTKLEVYRNLQSDTINRGNSAAFIRGQDIGLAIGQYGSAPYGTWLQSIKTNDTTYPLSLNPLGSNVGIGTSSPITKLHVYGDLAVGGDNSDAILRFIESTDGWTIRHVAIGNRLAMSNVLGGTDHFNITETGNVGIGTTAPGYKLTVAGETYTSSRFVTATGELLSVYQDQWTNGASHYVVYNAWRASIGDYLLLKSAGNQANSNGAIVIADGNGGKVYFGLHANTSPANDSSTDPLDSTYGWVGASTTYFSSSVGIGERSIDAKLHLTAATSGLINQKFESAGSAAWRIGIPASQTYFAFDNSADALTSPKMVIDSSGNLGVGTTAPAYKIDVSGGAIAIRGNAAGNSLRFDDSAGTSRNAFYVDTSNYLNIGNANYAGVKFVQTSSAPTSAEFQGNAIQNAIGGTDNGTVLAEPAAWLAVRVGTTDYAIPMYTTG